MSTIVSSDQSSVFFIYISVGKYQTSIDNMAKTKLTPRATQTDKTKQFIIAVDEALEKFEEEISSLSENTRQYTYKNFITSYHDAMNSIWNLLRFANVNTVLDTIADKEFSELKVMKSKLRKKPPQGTVVKEGIKIPTLEDFTETMKKKLPKRDLPDSKTCSKIGDVFLKLASASKAYSEAASGITELASKIELDQMTLLLCAATLPTIQIVIPGQLLSLVATQPSTTLRKRDIINIRNNWSCLIDTISFIVVAIVSHALPGTNVHWLNPCI